MSAALVVERDTIGRTASIRTRSLGKSYVTSDENKGETNRSLNWIYITNFLTRAFLPTGYPNTVSPDYLRYQILNALQAFCNSLAGLLSSRAILQGFGVGDPTASATKALLLTVLQDVFGRLTTILSAHLFGSSLYPEAKTYRFLADILNDAAVILDTLSPLFLTFPGLPELRIAFLCLSAVFKSLCGICSGGSKAAITNHFASPILGKGDVGDLNAKDSSKETVLALLGMLIGTLIVPHLLTPSTTYSTLFILVGLHLAINYYGVRGLQLRTLNRQRTTIAYLLFRTKLLSIHNPHQLVRLMPAEIAEYERIFERSGVIRDPTTGHSLGHCTIGSSFAEVVHVAFPPELITLFAREQYILWFDETCLRPSPNLAVRELYGPPRLHIFLKERYTSADQLRAWVHGVELCRIVSHDRSKLNDFETISTSYDSSQAHFESFLKALDSSHWVTSDCTLLTGSPRSLIILSELEDVHEEKKTQ